MEIKNYQHVGAECPYYIQESNRQTIARRWVGSEACSHHPLLFIYVYPYTIPFRLKSSFIHQYLAVDK